MKTPFGETSSVVTLLTREIGKLRALAKGAWRPKGPFDGALDLFSTCEVIVLRRASGGLDLLTEACLLERFRIAGSLAAYQATVGLTELTDALTADADPQPELFDAVVASVHAHEIGGTRTLEPGSPSNHRTRSIVDEASR